MVTPTFEQLIAFAAGDLPEPQRNQVASFVASNPDAAAAVNAWRTVSRIAAGDDSVEVPAAALARAKSIFNSRAAQSARPSVVANWLQAIDRFVATLIYDSRVQPASVRFAESDDRRTMTFQTADGDVDLQAERIPEPVVEGASQPARWRIMGQVAEPECAARDIALVEHEGNSPLVQVLTDARGTFSVECPAGRFDILIRRGDGSIVLSPIDLT